MEREQMKKILAVMEASYSNLHFESPTEAVDTWNWILEGYEYSEISAALKFYIDTSDSAFAPSPGQLIAIVKKIRGEVPLDLTFMATSEAWSMVRKAIQNSAYDSVKEFQKLPKTIQQAVGSANQLQAWATDSDYNENVVMSIFSRHYGEICNRKKEFYRLNDNQKKILKDRQLKFLWFSNGEESEKE